VIAAGAGFSLVDFLFVHLPAADLRRRRRNMTAELRHEPVHSKFGGSVAARVLNCPASVGLVEKVPAYLRKPSAYADRGTACHAAITLLLAEDVHSSVEKLAGKTFGDYTITPDDVATALRPVYAHVETLLDTPGAEYFLERRVVFPTIPDTWGTVDLLVRNGRTIHVTDFKFGVGVRVFALTPDGDEDVINAQLLFYAAAARHSLPEFFAGVEYVVLTIIQPVAVIDAEMVSSVTVTHAELDEFVTVYRAACEQALSDAPRLQLGSWCRFCPARPICPEHTKPLLDLAQFVVPTAFAAPKEAIGAQNHGPQISSAKEAWSVRYLQVLADGLNLVDAVKDIRTALHDQAKRALEQGDHVPGYALSAGRAERHWRDEIVAQVALLSLGFDHDDIIETETMRSPKQLEIRAKARGLEIPKELIGSRRSGVSLVRSENVRVPVLGRGELARTFSEALEAFLGGRQG
jgi:hypothetical protein